MTRVNNRHDAINLAQGFPEFDPPEDLIREAHRALDGKYHQYAVTWGTDSIREANRGQVRQLQRRRGGSCPPRYCVLRGHGVDDRRHDGGS